MSNVIRQVGSGRTFLSTNDLFVQADTSVGQVEIVLPNSALIFADTNSSNTPYNYIGVKRGALINPDLDKIDESESYFTTSGIRPDSSSVQAVVELTKDDEVYFIVQNTSATNDITIEFINLIIERTN